MIDNKILTVLLDYSSKIVAEKMNGTGDIVAMRSKNGFIASDVNVGLDQLTANDFKEYSLSCDEPAFANIAKIFEKRQDVHAVCYTHAPFVCAVARAKATIPAMLDDMAQIVGITCRTSKSNKIADIFKALKGRNSCLIPEGGALTMGRTMDEAYTCALVLDKASHAYVCGSVIGGNKIINCFEAKLMNFVYKKKYSKANQQNISQREGE